MTGTVALNGEVRRLEELRLGDFLQSFFFGAGFFETFLIEEGAPRFLERHLTRLQASLTAHEGSVRAPPAQALTPNAVRESLRQCLAADAGLGPRFTGVGKLVAGDGHLLLTFRPLPPHHEASLREGLALEHLEERGYRRGDPLARHKSVSYLRQYAHLGRGTVFANELGELCEAPNGNLFFLLDDALVTPPVEAPCLPGIIRAVLLEERRWTDKPIEERTVRREHVEHAHGCILTNSVSLALPIPRLFGRALPHSAELARSVRALVEARARLEA
ncbi:aminotransferase class IV [Melittangium boletus]|uniref:branched-chain-amino-acid transaminase n=1 Tax=Melittangium boletus DSM 14713 TaxID=1294270 RepID=A0A250IKL1_9BACT|nr:aminotransferase class IV [Melittangium boletus]ATB31697.1 para-aminobenzoate synthase [Melittangium boletus DSM 14713]